MVLMTLFLNKRNDSCIEVEHLNKFPVVLTQQTCLFINRQCQPHVSFFTADYCASAKTPKYDGCYVVQVNIERKKKSIHMT